MNEKNVFEYSYSAKQQEEIAAIREKYLPKKEKNEEMDKLEELRRIDKKVEQTATLWAILVGVVGTLVFGSGMSIVLVLENNLFLLGLLLGLLGIVGIAAAHLIYRMVLKKEREKAAPKILALTKELEGKSEISLNEGLLQKNRSMLQQPPLGYIWKLFRKVP